MSFHSSVPLFPQLVHVLYTAQVVSAAEEEKEKAAEMEAASKGAQAHSPLQKSDSKGRPVISPISPGEEVSERSIQRQFSTLTCMHH
jgi:hypothetical protein